VSNSIRQVEVPQGPVSFHFGEALAKSMSSKRKSGDKSLFPTTIVMLVPGSIKQRNLASF
jgi:hypothetical protein